MLRRRRYILDVRRSVSASLVLLAVTLLLQTRPSAFAISSQVPCWPYESASFCASREEGERLTRNAGVNVSEHEFAKSVRRRISHKATLIVACHDVRKVTPFINIEILSRTGI